MRWARKHFLMILSMLAFCGLSNPPVLCAQGSPDACVYCVCQADGSCTDLPMGACPESDLTTVCASTTFQSRCSGRHTIRATLKCTSGNECEHCQSCVLVYDGTTQVGYCHAGCGVNSCTQDCQTTADLVSGHSYTLYVCKMGCTGNDCPNCQDCFAQGFVFRYAFTDCTPIPPCDP